MRVLRRRKTYVILAVVAVTAGALGLSLVQSKVYEGTASLLLAPKSSESLFVDNNQQSGQSPSALAETQIQLIQSAPVAQEVQKRIGIAPAISISQVGQTQVVRLHARSTTPATAALVANTYAKAYIDVRRSQALRAGQPQAHPQRAGGPARRPRPRRRPGIPLRASRRLGEDQGRCRPRPARGDADARHHPRRRGVEERRSAAHGLHRGTHV